MVLPMDPHQLRDHMEARCCRSTKSLTDFGLGLLLIAVLGTDLGTEQAETNPYNRDAAEQAGRRNRG